MGQKQLLDVTQAGDLKDLWLLLYHLPVEPRGQGREPRKGSNQRLAGSGDTGLAWPGHGAYVPPLLPPTPAGAVGSCVGGVTCAGQRRGCWETAGWDPWAGCSPARSPTAGIPW